jgi:hypothetical protein
MWDFLNDAPHQEDGNFDPMTGTPTSIRQDQWENMFGIFVQDDLKVSSNLTLNLGLRWSYFGPLYAKQNNMLRAVPGAGADFLTGLVIRKDDSWNPQYTNFGPQIGFAWSPSKYNSKFVIRGGYGLNYNQEQIAISSNIDNNLGLVVAPTLLMSKPSSPNPGIIYALSSGVRNLNGFPPNPNTITSFGPNGLPTTGLVNVQLFPTDLSTMRVHHYSLDTQIDFGHQFVATLGYLGSASHNIFFHETPNAVPATRGFALSPQIGGGDFWNTNGRANYNAMLAELKHQFANQFMADAQFTWAKSMDTVPDPTSSSPILITWTWTTDVRTTTSARPSRFLACGNHVFFHGSHSWIEKIAGSGRSAASSIFTLDFLSLP